ncbi:hypothetical protein WME89_07830 [Sorangium sp. So ce321]|uniref:hypothetical protein n=1 Tax=Sorangium sp. So ce321 TaxID=3133300 RepID=UPI003F5F02DC
MTRMFRGMGAIAAAGVLFVVGISGCVSHAGDDAELGSISLPLAADAPSGARYQLRNATFQIWSDYYWYGDGAVGVGGSGGVSTTTGGGVTTSTTSGGGGSTSSTTSGGGGDSGGNTLLTISSEDEDPDASSITVDLERGSYYVSLLPGWYFEKIEGGVATPVEATLLSSSSFYVYVSPHSTTWAQYQFGIGDRALWLNGKLNIGVNVYEDPSDYYYYGEGGAGGGGTGGGWEGSVSVAVSSSSVGAGGSGD